MANINIPTLSTATGKGFGGNHTVVFMDLSKITNPADNDTVTFFEWEGGTVLGAKFEIISPNGANATLTLQNKLGTANIADTTTAFTMQANGRVGLVETWYPALPIRAADNVKNQLMFKFGAAGKDECHIKITVEGR